MDFSFLISRVICWYTFLLACVSRCGAGGYLGWILNHPVHQSDFPQAAALVNDSMDGLPALPASIRNERVSTEDLNTLCQSGKPCGRGRYCDTHYGKCERIKRRGDFCRKDNHCQRKHECVFGRCRKEVPSGQENARCRSDADCSDSHCCARQHGEMICKPRMRLGMKCFVPAGGLDYSLNEQCPCESGLICQYEPVKTTTQASVLKAARNEWFQFTTDTAQMKCLEIVPSSSPRSSSPAESVHETDTNNRDDDFTT